MCQQMGINMKKKLARKKHFTKIKVYALLVLILFSALAPLKAMAVDWGFFSSNDILFYNPTPTCLSQGNSNGNLTGKNNEEKIWCYLLTNFKLSKNGAIGVMGNLMRETGNTWEPDTWQGGGLCNVKSSPNCGYGLAQWSALPYKFGPKSLWAFAGSTFPNTDKVKDLKTQLDFLKISLNRDALVPHDGKTLMSRLQSPTITFSDAAYQYLRLYGYWNENYPFNDCSTRHPANCRGQANAVTISQDTRLMNLPCGNTTTNPTVSGTKPVILLGPGHTGTAASRPPTRDLGNPPIADNIYGNDPELQDVWDVSQIVKPILESKGYTVLMTKDSVQGGTYQWNRAQQANNNNVALALEIHTSSPNGSFGNYAQTWSQIKNGYVTATDGTTKVYSVASADVIAKSKEYAIKMAKARKDAGETGSVAMTSEAGFYHRSDPDRTTTIVQLWSKVPWIYLEAGADSSMDHKPSGGITDAQKQIYAKGIVDGVLASVPPGSSSDCATPGDGSKGDAIAALAIKLSWDDQTHGWTPRPEYPTYFDEYCPGCVGAGYTECNQFVAVVVRASGADPNYSTDGVGNSTYGQVQYAEHHPDLYQKLTSTNTNDLHPGDIMMLEDHHTWIYVGSMGGGYNIREASEGGHAPQVGTLSYQGSSVDAFRLK